MKHYGDIRALDGAKLPPVDCITGGSPCQDLSVGGKRAGLADWRSREPGRTRRAPPARKTATKTETRYRQ